MPTFSTFWLKQVCWHFLEIEFLCNFNTKLTQINLLLSHLDYFSLISLFGWICFLGEKVINFEFYSFTADALVKLGWHCYIWRYSLAARVDCLIRGFKFGKRQAKRHLRLQSKSVKMNSLGPSEFVRYNRKGVFRKVTIWDHIILHILFVTSMTSL